ncbi:MAG: DNA-binding domain-containing protein [Emergencia sp.]|nr:DNA-binding domain-containing protein [Emergencia sp.]
MKYYLIDDEIGIVKTLENIIESRDLGEVSGYSTDPARAAEEIIGINPDIVLADLLMSGKDGISLVGEIKKVRPHILFVMISKVTDKSMVEQAYSAGVEFFIHKPINVIEVERVLRNVSDRLKMKNIVSNIRGIFEEEERTPAGAKKNDSSAQEINLLLGLLGMLGEKGTPDILAICRYLDETGESYSKEVLVKVAENRGESPKNLEQRMRRAIKKGLVNVANLAIDDYSNEVFQIYAGYVFDFKNIKDEMEFIKGNSAGGGRVNLSKFIEGLLLYRDTVK